MSETKAPRPAVTPFLIGDLLLLAAMGGIVYQSPWPLSPTHVALCVAATALGAWLLVTPFILQYRAEVKLSEADKLSAAVTQMQTMREIQEQIAQATGMWQNIQGECARTAVTAKEVADGMAAEARGFQEFLAKANDAEKATLRLEVDKLRRAEMDWIQVVVRLLDNVHALNLAAVASGQTRLIEQIGQFQFVCRDATRRVGLNPFEVASGEVFNPQVQRLADSNVKPAEGAKVARTLAPGFTFQGNLLRPALVELMPEESAAPMEIVNATAENISMTEPTSAEATPPA
jgi:molecular chaperone GrpE (heat shock protein)